MRYGASRIVRIALRPLVWLLAVLQPDVDALSARRSLKRLGAASGATLRRNVQIMHPEKLRLGRNVLLNHNVHISAGGGVTIGDDVVIGPGVMILTTNHVGPNYFGSIEHEPISIGSNVWLGAGCIVLAGVTIADGVMVGAGAVVTKDLKEPGRYLGVPARLHVESS